LRMRVAVAILQQAWLSAIASGCQRLRLACARTAISVTTYCRAISKSKLACNSNFRFLFGGSDAFYTTKYSTKDTQKEDTEGFDEVVALTRKRMIKQVFESPFSESMSRLIGATIVHNSKNVISAPMASYLSRNNSRFKMSHTLYFGPLRDIKEHLDGKRN
jgi:hypothetical protein